MKKIGLLVSFILILTVSVFAASHEHGGHGKGHGEEKASMGKMVYKGEKKGISIKVEFSDIETAMMAMMKDKTVKIDKSKMDPNLTHHLAIAVEKSDKVGEIKSATLKLTFKNETKSYQLFSMHGHYGSDISMKEKGAYNAVLTFETEKAGKVSFNFNLKN